jgi:uncharacterized protein (TIGR00269 family)
MTLGKNCSKCNVNSFISLEYAGTQLCKKHFLEMFERRFRSTVREFGMINKGETIALGLSGGKDSVTLLHLLAGLRKVLPFTLIAITVDYGVTCDYGKKTMNIAKESCKSLDVPHHVVTFKEEIGFTLGDIVKKTKTKNPCSYCGVIRRRILNKTARELGANKLAIAHTLDDTVQTVIMNLMRNEPMRLLRYVEPLVKDGNFVPRIRPLIRASENEVISYGKLRSLKIIEKSCCPYAKSALRRPVRTHIDMLEDEHPGTKIGILNSFLWMNKKLRAAVSNEKLELIYCKKCGEPASVDECMYCKMVSQWKST